MAENDRINTMREAMIRELFADIDGLADRIEKLQSSLPAVAGEIEAKLQPLRDDLTVIVGQLDAEAKRVVSEGKAALKGEGYDQGKKLEVKANALLDQHAAKARELVSKAVAESVHQPVRDAVTQVVAVANGLDIALAEVKTATSIMKTVTGQTVQGFAKDLDQAAKRVSWSWWERAALCFGSALFGALLAIAIVKATGWIGAPRAKANLPAFSLDQKQK